MKKRIAIFLTPLFLLACQGNGALDDATQGEKDMAKMMGITVEELRDLSPEDRMDMMQGMMGQ